MLLYATTGDHFAFGSRITWSVVPDGTNIGGTTSNLIGTLNQRFGSVYNWLPAIQDAFAQWESVANVNLVQVPDSGQPLGSGNIQQGSPAFGDIRIYGFSQDLSTLAFTLLPPAANGGSDSGDILFNTSLAWNIGSNYDLETVAVHEIGHALGLGHSADPTAAMYPYYAGAEPYANTDDVQGIDSIWGPRAEDPVEVNTGNLVMSRAADITAFMTKSNNQAYMPGLDVAKPGEAYWFKITTPANASSTFTAQVQSYLLSSLSPRVVLFTATGQGLTQAVASTTSYGAIVTASITNATPNTTYYIKVLGSNAGASGVGAYALTVNMGTQAIPLAQPPNTLVYAQPDQGGGGSSERIGGFNKPANTPIDLPEPIALGAIRAKGDSLLAPTHKAGSAKHPTVHVKAPHPAPPPPVRQAHPRAKVARPSGH